MRVALLVVPLLLAACQDQGLSSRQQEQVIGIAQAEDEDGPSAYRGKQALDEADRRLDAIESRLDTLEARR